METKTKKSVFNTVKNVVKGVLVGIGVVTVAVVIDKKVFSGKGVEFASGVISKGIKKISSKKESSDPTPPVQDRPRYTRPSGGNYQQKRETYKQEN